ncbi:MAG: aminotransferase class V-fold PLP-dependent enzyme [Rhodospirillales bacterium]|jgi:selenocysteine lyase/cysteine desulfurase
MTTTTENAAALQTEPDWAALRREFPTLENVVYLDISKKAILPRRVEEYMSEWMQDIYEDGGARAYSMDCIEETRQVVADVFGMPSSNLSLIKNTSEGVNIVAQGFPWREGDNVVISEFEHENNTFPWRHLTERGVEVRWAAPDAEGRVTVDQYQEIVDDRTRIIAAAWVAYGNGYRADVPKIADFCRDRGIKLVIDGIQAVGVLATPIAELGADVFVTGGHKAQFSLAGAGFMYATDEMIEMLTPPYAAKYSFTSNDRMQTSPELAHDGHRFEYGNPNFLGCWIQKRSADYIAEIGLANIEARVQLLTTALMEEAERRQFKVRTPRPWTERAGIVSFDIGGHAGEKQAQLRARNIVVSEKDGHLRTAVHFYNSEDDLTRFLDALQAA